MGSPFSTFDCGLMLSELGVARSEGVMKGIAGRLLDAWQEDGRFRPAPKGAIYPCHTANAARVLCRLGYAKDKRLARTFEHLRDVQHTDGGWRCNMVKLGKSPITAGSDPGVTLAALDAFRLSPRLNRDKRLDKAAKSLPAHWQTRCRLGPCGFGIGSLFMKVETPNRKLTRLSFCEKGRPSRLAMKRYREVLKNIDREAQPAASADGGRGESCVKARRSREERSLGLADVGRLGPFFSLGGFEFDGVALVEGFVAAALDVAVVNEDVRATVVRGDESESLGLIKPFYYTLHHSSLCSALRPALAPLKQTLLRARRGPTCCRARAKYRLATVQSQMSSGFMPVWLNS